MSNNPQWKTLQPPIMNSDPAILEYKSLTCSKVIGSNHTPINSYRNGTNYGGDYSDSPPGKNSSTFNNYSGAQTSPRNGTARFPIGTFTGLEGSVGYSGEPVTGSNNSSYQSDQSTNQNTRETGIIEKLLVIHFSLLRRFIRFDHCQGKLVYLIMSFFFFLSIRTVLFSAVRGKQDCFFTLANSVALLNILKSAILWNLK